MMYEDGLIYRGGRIVNWDPKCKRPVADDEIEYIEEKAEFYTLNMVLLKLALQDQKLNSVINMW